MDRESQTYLAPAALIAALMLILALLPWPYGYYQLLRLVVTITGCFCAWVARRAEEKWVVVGLIGAVLIFNPLIPLHLEREQWAVLNVAGAVLFGVTFVRVRRAVLD